MHVTCDRIQSFWDQHGRMPTTPDELPIIENRDCSMKDGWGRQLNWDSNGADRVRLWSLGRDGIPGGSGEDADQEIVFIGKEEDQNEPPAVETIGN